MPKETDNFLRGLNNLDSLKNFDSLFNIETYGKIIWLDACALLAVFMKKMAQVLSQDSFKELEPVTSQSTYLKLYC
jgi:hypothetical protein